MFSMQPKRRCRLTRAGEGGRRGGAVGFARWCPSTRGFSLAEVVVALVVLEVGVVGALGTLVVAAQTARTVARNEAVDARMQALLDSVSLLPAPASGVADAPVGSLVWEISAGGRVRVAQRSESGEAGAGLWTYVRPR